MAVGPAGYCIAINSGFITTHWELIELLSSSTNRECVLSVFRGRRWATIMNYAFVELQDMKSRLEACAAAFGEEASASPEQLFGAMDSFLTQLAEARAECDATRRRRDEEERRTRHEQEVNSFTRLNDSQELVFSHYVPSYALWLRIAKVLNEQDHYP